jgi:hypothetical protein
MSPPPRKYLVHLPPAEDTTSGTSGFVVTPGFLRFVGETVFGDKWQTRMAEALGQTRAKKLSPATVHQWTTRQRSIPLWVHEALPIMITQEERRLIARADRTRELGLRLQRADKPPSRPTRRQDELSPTRDIA